MDSWHIKNQQHLDWKWHNSRQRHNIKEEKASDNQVIVEEASGGLC